MARKKVKVHLGRLPRIIVRPLGKQGAYGLANHPDFVDRHDTKAPEPLIEIDTRTKGRKRLEILLHEAAHIAIPGLTEDTIKVLTRYQARVLHGVGYHADEVEMNENFKGDPA